MSQMEYKTARYPALMLPPREGGGVGEGAGEEGGGRRGGQERGKGQSAKKLDTL